MTPPAAVVEKMAAAIDPIAFTAELEGFESRNKERARKTATACVAAAAEAGYVLVAKADVDWAANAVEAQRAFTATLSVPYIVYSMRPQLNALEARHCEVIQRLRSALGNAGTV